MRKKIIVLILPFLLIPSRGYSILGDGGAGWAQIPYLVNILSENYKRYQQLQLIMNQAKQSEAYLRNIHKGLESITGLVSSLPVGNNGVFANIRNFNQSLRAVSKFYGPVPKSPREPVHTLHDETVAESIKMSNDFNDYSKSQEKNSVSLKIQSQNASPKGAARSTAVSNALILESINQLIKLQSQSLKLQSAQLAVRNRQDKESVASYQNVDVSLGNAFKTFQPKTAFIKF